MGWSIFSKKRTKTGGIVVKTNSFVRFLKEIDDPRNHFEINLPLKGSQDFWVHRFPPKNERMNSFLLLCDMFSFVFWRKSTTPKNRFKINWPLKKKGKKVDLRNSEQLLSGVAKGQLISKRFLEVVDFLKKTNENTSHTSKNELIRSFFGRILAFEISWPLIWRKN